MRSRRKGRPARRANTDGASDASGAGRPAIHTYTGCARTTGTGRRIITFTRALEGATTILPARATYFPAHEGEATTSENSSSSCSTRSTCGFQTDWGRTSAVHVDKVASQLTVGNSVTCVHNFEVDTCTWLICLQALVPFFNCRRSHAFFDVHSPVPSLLGPLLDSRSFHRSFRGLKGFLLSTLPSDILLCKPLLRTNYW